jgi:hypothetical protein
MRDIFIIVIFEPKSSTSGGDILPDFRPKMSGLLPFLEMDTLAGVADVNFCPFAGAGGVLLRQ